MARTDTLGHFLTDIANKIRSKTGSQSNITPANYDTEIEKIKFKTDSSVSLFFNNNYNSINFTSDSSITSVDTKNIDTSELTSMRNMFNRCASLTSLDLSEWNTSKVTNMRSMFSKCSSLTSLDLSSFDTRNVSLFNSMFSGCTNLETITFGTNFKFDSAATLSMMFKDCIKLDDNTLNAILHICTTINPNYTESKTLYALAIESTFVNYNDIPNLSNYQEFLDAGWTIS